MPFKIASETAQNVKDNTLREPDENVRVVERVVYKTPVPSQKKMLHMQSMTKARVEKQRLAKAELEQFRSGTTPVKKKTPIKRTDTTIDEADNDDNVKQTGASFDEAYIAKIVEQTVRQMNNARIKQQEIDESDEEDLTEIVAQKIKSKTLKKPTKAKIEKKPRKVESSSEEDEPPAPAPQKVVRRGFMG